MKRTKNWYLSTWICVKLGWCYFLTHIHSFSTLCGCKRVTQWKTMANGWKGNICTKFRVTIYYVTVKEVLHNVKFIIVTVRIADMKYSSSVTRPYRSMISARYRQKEERRKMLKISAGKLSRIDDPEASLCRSVLINNTLRRLRRESSAPQSPAPQPAQPDFAQVQLALFSSLGNFQNWFSFRATELIRIPRSVM